MTLGSSSQHHLEEDRVCGFYQSHSPALAEQQQRWQHGSTSAIVVAATRSCHQLSAPSHSHLSLTHTHAHGTTNTTGGRLPACCYFSPSLPSFLTSTTSPFLLSILLLFHLSADSVMYQLKLPFCSQVSVPLVFLHFSPPPPLPLSWPALSRFFRQQ